MIANLRKKKTNRKSSRFEIHATDVVKRCLREILILYSLGLPLEDNKKYPDKTLLTFRLGLSIEDMVRELLNGKKCPPIAIHIGNIYLVGSPDIIVKDRYIVECKSINRTSFCNLKEPVPEHVSQLSFYLWLAHKQPTLNLCSTVGGIVYVPKEEAPVEDVFKVFEVRLYEGMIERFNKVVAQIKSFQKTGKLPKSVCNNNRHPWFRNCRVSHICRERLS